MTKWVIMLIHFGRHCAPPESSSHPSRVREYRNRSVSRSPASLPRPWRRRGLRSGEHTSASDYVPCPARLDGGDGSLQLGRAATKLQPGGERAEAGNRSPPIIFM